MKLNKEQAAVRFSEHFRVLVKVYSELEMLTVTRQGKVAKYGKLPYVHMYSHVLYLPTDLV